MNKITPFLWFNDNAEAAADFYLSIFPDGRKLNELRCTEAGPLPVGALLAIDIEIAGQQVTFLNGGPGDHHIFGFIASTHRGFHHASFEVPSIDAIALGADRMRSRGRDAGWGLGRHTIGSNFFHYNPDPWGSWIEWFSDIDQVDDSWVAGEWEVPPHLWGAPPPETFLANRGPPA